jgi:ATP synthase protein I
MKNNKIPPKEDNSDRSWVSYLGLGIELAATVTIMFFIGVWLDKKFKTEPILTVIFSLLGVASGLYNFIKTALKSN